MSEPYVYCGPQAIPNFLTYCKEHHHNRFFMVCDHNTYPILGQRVESLLKEQGAEVKLIYLTGEEVIADETYLMQVLLEAGDDQRAYIAVGSGTLTDITRFCSHRTRLPFLSLPTAPSVDGFTSVGAPLVFRRFKQTIPCKAPEAVFADINTLCESPRLMIASGFGDMLGKYTALADWKLGVLIHDEIYRYDETVWQRSWKALSGCVAQLESIKRAGCEGVESLFMGLIETGLCILQVGHACPAAGAEHHLSHYLEMKLLQENRPAVLHGAKVGYATILVAQRYKELRQLSKAQVASLLKKAPAPTVESEIARIRAFFGPMTDLVLVQQRRLLEIIEKNWGMIQQRIIDHWDEVQQIADWLPEPAELKRMLADVGGPVTPEGITFDEKTVMAGLDYAHYLRDRITVIKLGHLLGLW